MIKVKVMRLDKNGMMKKYTMKFKDTNTNNLEIEKLAELAEDYYVDKAESWRQLTKKKKRRPLWQQQQQEQ